MGQNKNTKQSLLSQQDRQRIVLAIEKAERNTSGEIRVRVERACKEEVLDRAAWWFKQLQMQKTQLRNGVLIYVAVDSRLSAIIGDAGIHAQVGNDFWSQTHGRMIENFSKACLADGIVEAIEEVGQRLHTYFPYESRTDIDELSNEVSMEE